MKIALTAVVLAASWLLLPAAHAQPNQPTPTQIEQAKAHFQRARDHLAAAEYPQAIGEYQAAYRLYPDPEFLFNIGEAYRLAGDKRNAVDYFRRYLEAEPNGRGSADARAAVDELEKKLAAEPPPSESGPGESGPTTTGPAATTGEEAKPGKPATPETAVTDRVPLPAPTPYPAAWVDRPLQLPRAAAQAELAARALTGPYFNWDADEWQRGVARWITTDLRLRYGVTDRIEAGIDLPLTTLRPDKDDFEDSSRYGAMVRLAYSVTPEVSARIEGGTENRQQIIRNGYQVPSWDGVMRPGFGAGGEIAKRLGRVRVSVAPMFVVQLGSYYDEDSGCGEDDPDCWNSSLALQVPIAVHYQLTPEIVAGLRTGIYSGHQVSFDKEKNASVPVLAEGALTLAGGRIDVGAELGFANLYYYDDSDTSYPTEGSTFFFALTAAFRTR